MCSDWQVGHNALGAGQIIDQGARLVDKAISSGSMWTHEDGWMYIKPVRRRRAAHRAVRPLRCRVSAASSPVRHLGYASMARAIGVSRG